jgi:MFS superfamily sulfate permease-like transporter
MSAMVHGVLLLICVISIPFLLNMIPLATLAAVLLMVGYKLAKPSIFIHFFQKGKYQFVPFIATLLAVVFTDLLKGVALGIVISIIFVLRGNLKRAYAFRKEEYADGDVIHIDLAQEVSFLNKAAIKETLSHIPENSRVVISAHDTVYIAHDILDLIREFKTTRAIDENIKVKLKGFKKAYHLENSEEIPNHVSFTHKYDAAKRATVKIPKSEFAD